MQKISCSIPILTLNSAKHLRQCLESVQDFADVYLVDGNSTDNTASIAHEFGRLIYKQVESDELNIKIANFTDVRTRALGFAQTDWLLLLDSDEFLTPELTAEIRHALERAAPERDAFNIQKKYVVRGNKIEYAFNYPNYYMRLFGKSGGVRFKPGKKNHEQLVIPSAVAVRNLHFWIYSWLPDTYSACVRKDRTSVRQIRATTLDPSRRKDTRLHALKIAGLYFLRAANTIFRSFVVYLKHGYARSLPIGHVMRHVRNHFLMTWWRLQQVFLGK